MNITTKLLCFFGAMFFLALAALLGLLEFIAIVDPVGTKMTDDADPFGDPYIPLYVHFIWIFVILGFTAIAIWMLKKVG